MGGWTVSFRECCVDDSVMYIDQGLKPMSWVDWGGIDRDLDGGNPVRIGQDTTCCLLFGWK